MTVEQPKEDLRREDIDNIIKMVRLANAFLADKTKSDEEKKKFAKFFGGMFEQ
jgi:hypothetical protein